MRKLDLIAAVLFRLGLLISFIGTVTLAYFNFFRLTVWVEEFDRALTVAFIGLIMMLVSFALDFISTRKGDDNDR